MSDFIIIRGTELPTLLLHTEPFTVGLQERKLCSFPPEVKLNCLFDKHVSVSIIITHVLEVLIFLISNNAFGGVSVET